MVSEGDQESDEVRCPLCGGHLDAGHVSIDGGFVGFLFVGLSWQHLWFQPQGHAATRVRVLSPSRDRRAWRCTACGAVVVPGGSA